MRRRTLSMRVSAIIMVSVVGMSSMTMHVQAADVQERVVEDTNTIRVTLPDSISLHGGGRGGGLEGYATVSAKYTDTGEAVDTVRVTVNTSVEYTNTGDSSQKVTGSVTFGSSGVADWSVDNLKNNKSKYIMVEAPVPEKTGVYEGSIDYTIELRHDGDQLYDEEHYAGENYFYYTQTSGNTISIEMLTSSGMKWLNNTHTLIIPSQAQLQNRPYYYTVTSVRTGAFQYNQAITSVHIPTTLEYIPADVFRGCSSIQTVCYKGTREEFLQSQLYKNWCDGNEPLENAHWIFTDCESDFPAESSHSLVKENDIDLSDYEEMILESEINLYAKRGIESEVLKTLENGSVVYIITEEQGENGIWYEIYTADQVRGYIFIESSAEDDTETETEKGTETEESTLEEESTETEESSSEESSETEESTEEGSSEIESTETEESTNEESSGVESTETEESVVEEGTDESSDVKDSEESSGVEESMSEDAGTDESTTMEETSEEVIIEADGEEIPEETESDIPEVKIEMEVRDEDGD